MNLSYRQRVMLLAGLGVAAGVLLFGRLFLLQVVQGRRWEAQARAQVADWNPIYPPRGRLLDATGRELACDEAGFDLALCAAAWEGRLYECPRCGFHRYYRERQDPGRCPRCRGPSPVYSDRRDLGPVARLLQIPEADLADRIGRSVKRVHELVDLRLENYPEHLWRQRKADLWQDFGWRPRRIARDVPYEVAREVELHPETNPAFRITTMPKRRLTGGRDFVHIVGTVRLETMDTRDPGGHRRYVEVMQGADGLERSLDGVLGGRPGWVKVLTDPRSGETEVVEQRAPVPGREVQLTIAAPDQAQALLALRNATGAFVVVNSETGAVLAAASSPSYEPEDHARVFAELHAIFKDTGRWPLYHALKDNAFGAWHTPGSVMKPFTAVAALTGGTSTPETRVTCERYFTNRAGHVLHDIMKCDGEHGELDLHEALVRSCNIYFQTLMKRMIEEERFPHFAATGGRFGFGWPTGIELERSAYPDTYQFGTGWGMWVLSGIGQSDVRLSPAQVARAYAGLATGALPTLHVVARVGGRETPVRRTALDYSGAVLEPVRAALRDVPRRGTARGYGLDRWGIACKTGTAQVPGGYNAWLAGFAPARAGRPPIAFALVVLQSPHHGSEECGPRLAEFFRAFYGEAPE